MANGYLSLILHAHLPYVHHPETDRYLEERWLFEAITETYVPLLEAFERLEKDRVSFRITMSFSPVLLAMLASPLLQERFASHVRNLVDLAEKECRRTRNDSVLSRLAQGYRERFTALRDRYDALGHDLISPFRGLQDRGHLELITASATHAILPYVKTVEAQRVQLETAAVEYERHFGRRPQGLWLPECAYAPGIDERIAECGFRYFFVDAHGFDHATPRPLHGVYAPIATPAGPAAFARDAESSKQVWSSTEGYPGDFNYREYYRDAGYDLEWEYIKPHLHPDGIRHNTGIKYHRITGTEPKQYYDPVRAREVVGNQASDFVSARISQVQHLTEWMDRAPIVTAPYDAELFGHWWYEGPQWIEDVCRKIHFDQDVLEMATPSDYLDAFPSIQSCKMGMSTWGRDGHGDVWLNESNAWIYRSLHKAEEWMRDLASRDVNPRLANQAARELMLAESSDWAFIMDNKTMVDYAVKRTKWHMNRCERLYRMARGLEAVDEAWVSEVEQRDAVFPLVDYRWYRPEGSLPRPVLREKSRPTVLMFSWEFPPMTVGGLSRHVYDLSRYLLAQNWEVHVVTAAVPGYPLDEQVEGVHVHRVTALQPSGSEFIEWIYQLNLAMIDRVLGLISEGFRFDLLHAHDWLVAFAAKEIKLRTGLPLAATIHATENGRNHGIHTDLQRRIHQVEWSLTFEAWRVICCSQAMDRELQSLFSLPADKIDIIANGVDVAALRTVLPDDFRSAYALDNEKIVFFVGRLVNEKGVQVLVQAAPKILESCPDAKFVIAGRGPMLSELKALTSRLGLDHKIQFVGFVDDETRNRLFAAAHVSVFPSLYEPFGIVALEGMAAGSPVVVSDVGGMGEIVEHDVDGLKVFPGDVDSLALQVTRLLTDDVLARWLRSNAEKALVEKYDWAIIASQTIAVYDRILREKEALAV